jgi:putative glutamine amidotransferase
MMERPPIIGITTYAANDNNEVTLPENYVAAVRRAGGIPVLIAPGEQQIDALLDRIDGMILAGGGDICPSCYGGQPHEMVYMVDVARDRMELALALGLIGRDIPTLAICRGTQIVNVALGGTLHPHLPDVVGESVLHRAPPREPTPHAISVDSNSSIAKTMRSSCVEPMSWHHQAINAVAEPLKVVAHAPDGVIEAAEMPGHRWLLCVQWHPEITADRDPTQQRLFAGLVAEASNEEK